MKITAPLFEAFLKCPTKCHLRSLAETGSGNEYAEWVRNQNESYEREAVRRLQDAVPETERVVAPPANENMKTAKWRLAVDLVVQTPDRSADSHVRELETDSKEARGPSDAQPQLGSSGRESSSSASQESQSRLTSAATIVESRLHAVERVPAEGRGKAAQFVPIRFIYRNKLTKDDRLLLAFDALALSQALGREVSLGKIIHGDDHATLKVKTGARTAESARTSAKPRGLLGEVQKRLDKIATLLSSPTSTQSADSHVRESLPDGETRGLSGPRSAPDLVLNRHCAECEFQARCRKIAIEKDDLSLLATMSAKERQKLRSQGIFTVTQLSYTFRPRRRPKRLRDKREKYHHSLKALAIREKKIHIVGSPELKIEGTPVYLDVEGLPDRDFYYLIGFRIGHGDSAVQHSLWADTVAGEGKIWREFLAILETVEQPVLIHYGSYETDFLERMNARYGSPPEPSVAARAIGSPINLLSVIFGQFYFPAYTNGLKELANWLGFEWACPGVAGIQTVVWRHEWDKSATPNIRQDIAIYNAEDCAALETVTRVVCACDQKAGPPKPDLSDKCVRVDRLKPLPRFNLINKDGAALPEFKLINQAAYWDYQRIRVYVRTSKAIRKACRRRSVQGRAALVRRVLTHPRPTSCPICQSADLGRERACILVYDVKILPSGAKAWVTEQHFDRCRCRQCGSLVKPPTPHAFSLRKFGPTLRAYAVSQLIDLKIPGMTVAKSLSQLFRLELTGSIISQFKSEFAGLYTETIKKLIGRITKGPLVHADETKASVVGKSAVAWVLTSMEDVVFLYSESREGEMVQTLLRDFTGVLVSDFYAVYDAFNCPQQKCLIHLMRDINDDLHRYPFDPELRDIAHEFTGVLKPIVETIDNRGLKAHFLAKHKPSANRFLRWATDHEFDSEIARAYGKRIKKNREGLFTFLGYDGVPWNNNNAENAIRAFASIRQTVGGVWTEKGLREYLVLLSISETCKRRGLNFFEFLCSGETDLEGFVAKGRFRRSARNMGGTEGPQMPYQRRDKSVVKPSQSAERDALQVRATPFIVTESPSPWDRFRASGANDATPTVKRDLNLERFNKVPFGAGILAIPALAVSGFWAQATDLFPAWIERSFAEIALFRVASLVMSKLVNLEQAESVWPAAWDHLLARVQFPNNRSLMDLMNLIGQNRIGLGKWQGALMMNWLSSTDRVKAVLLFDREHRLLLEAPAISSVDERARSSLFTRCFAELWYRVLDGAPMLLLTQPASEADGLPWKEWILPQLRDVSRVQAGGRGEHTARESYLLTVVFTKGGVYPPLFRKLHRNGLHVLSYQLSTSGAWSDSGFTQKQFELEGHHRELMHVAERDLPCPGLTLHEVLCFHTNGPKVTVISSNHELDLDQIAARLAFEFTAHRFLDRQRNCFAMLGCNGTQHHAGGSLQSNALKGEDFLRTVVVPVFRAEAMMEQMLREKSARRMESPLALRDVLCKRIDLLPSPGAHLLDVLVHIGNDASEQSAVSHLCAVLTATETCFPGTNLKLVYKPELASPR